MKTVTETNYIQKLISEGEHVCQDFKFAISDARKIAKSLSAFANTQGGRLLVGVKDNGKIAGVRSEEEIYMIDAAAQMYCQPPVKLENYIYIRWRERMCLKYVSQKVTGNPYALSTKQARPGLMSASRMRTFWPALYI